MTRTLPILLVLATAACGGLQPQLPTGASEPTVPAADSAAPSGAWRGGAFILPDPCTDVVGVTLTLGVRDEDGIMVNATYTALGTPRVSRCDTPPSWASKPEAKIVPLKTGFSAYVILPADGRADDAYVVSATAPNGVTASVTLPL